MIFPRDLCAWCPAPHMLLHLPVQSQAGQPRGELILTPKRDASGGCVGEGNVLGRLGGLTCWRCECEPGAMQKTLGLESEHHDCEPWLWP